MHSTFCSKLSYKLLVKACIDSHLAGMGGSSQVWVKMWWGEGHPIRTVQLGVRRVRELDLVDEWDRTKVDACQVYHRTSKTHFWQPLGFFHIYPQYGIKPGGEPPANGKRWALCVSNGVYYHADRISAPLCQEYEAWKQYKKAKQEQKTKKAKQEQEQKEAWLEEGRKMVEEAYVQRLLRENMEEDDARDEDDEQADPSCKRRRVQAGGFKFATSASVSGTNWEKQAAPMSKRLRIQRGGA